MQEANGDNKEPYNQQENAIRPSPPIFLLLRNCSQGKKAGHWQQYAYDGRVQDFGWRLGCPNASNHYVNTTNQAEHGKEDIPTCFIGLQMRFQPG